VDLPVQFGEKRIFWNSAEELFIRQGWEVNAETIPPFSTETIARVGAELDFDFKVIDGDEWQSQRAELQR